MIKHYRLALIFFTALSVAFTLPAADITVFAAASLTDSLKEIAADYEQKTGDKVLLNLGASSTLERQIEAGAPADIFLSADEAQMNVLAGKSLLDSTTRKSLLGNSLVVVVTTNSSLSIVSASSLTNVTIKQIAFADPKAVPAGVYGKAWLVKQGLWSMVEPKIIPCQNVRAALAAVESGNVDAGVVYKTDAGISKKVKIAYEVPVTNALDISYPVALVKDGPQPAAAKKFLDYIESETAGSTFEKFGFTLRN